MWRTCSACCPRPGSTRAASTRRSWNRWRGPAGSGTARSSSTRSGAAPPSVPPGCCTARGCGSGRAATPTGRGPWAASPGSRGRWPTRRRRNGARPEPDRRPYEGNTHFAGEYTSEVAQGYMEGGAESGVRAADEVLVDLGVTPAG
ncbi:FAD-dependent oxidoreductase [Streptomyces hydrogenans]